MRRRCVSCGSYNTYVDLPGDREENLKLFEAADVRMIENTPIPLKCNECGYRWEVIISGEKKVEERK